MQGILKDNYIETIGGTVPQGKDVNIIGQLNGWTIVEIADEAISSFQEFNIQPIDDNFSKAITGPQQEGAYNEYAYGVKNFGDKMRLENNPNQVIVGIPGIPDGTPIELPASKDDKTQKNFTAEEVQPYKNARNFIKKYDAKSILRNQIRGNIVDIEDDIADTKIASQMLLYYFAHEWNNRTPDQKNANPSKNNMDRLVSKLLSDETKLRADFTNGMESINDILEKEEIINTFVTNNYKYDASRGI